MRVYLALALGLVGCGRMGFDAENGFLFRDDFESGDLSAWGGVNVTTGASLQVMMDGSHVLDASVPAIRNGAAAAALAPIAPHAVGMLAFRERVLAPTALVHFDGVLTPRSDAHHISIGADDNGKWVATEGFAGTSAADHHSSVAAGIGVWQCVELDYTFARGDAAAQIEVKVDGQLVLSVAALDPDAMFDEGRFGVTRADAAGAHAVIDDVAIAEQPIGCD